MRSDTHDFGNWNIEGHVLQQGTANITISQGAEQAALSTDHHNDTQRFAVKRSDSLFQSGFRTDECGFPLLHLINLRYLLTKRCFVSRRRAY